MEEYHLKKLKKYWNKLYENKNHKYGIKNLKLNTKFYKDIYIMFDENPINLYTIENIMENIKPSKTSFDYYQKKEFFEIIKFLQVSKESHKYQKQYILCKKNGYNLKNYFEIIY